METNMLELDHIYFGRRAREEHVAAAAAATGEGRAAHLRLAECYEDVARRHPPPGAVRESLGD